MFRRIASIVACLAATLASVTSQAAEIKTTITGKGSGHLRVDRFKPMNMVNQQSFTVTITGDTNNVSTSLMQFGTLPPMTVSHLQADTATISVGNSGELTIVSPVLAFYNNDMGVVGFSKIVPSGSNDFLNVQAGSSLNGYTFNANALITDPMPPQWPSDFFDLQLFNGGQVIMNSFQGPMTFQAILSAPTPEPTSALLGIVCAIFTRRSRR
jgi:hypothetical protein